MSQWRHEQWIYPYRPDDPDSESGNPKDGKSTQELGLGPIVMCPGEGQRAYGRSRRDNLPRQAHDDPNSGICAER